MKKTSQRGVKCLLKTPAAGSGKGQGPGSSLDLTPARRSQQAVPCDLKGLISFPEEAKLVEALGEHCNFTRLQCDLLTAMINNN